VLGDFNPVYDRQWEVRPCCGPASRRAQ